MSLQADDPLQYASTGASITTPIGPVRVEGFKQAGGGEAVSGRFSTRFLGTSLSLRGQMYNDFESPEAGFNTNRKKFDTEIEAQKNVHLGFGTLSLGGNASHLETEAGVRNTRFSTQQSLAWRGLRLQNRTATQVLNDKHSSTSGAINATYRVRRWRFRPSMNYSYFPQARIDSIGANINYKVANNYSVDFRTTHDFPSAATTAGVTFSKEFDKFLASVAGDWDSEDGLTVTFRASTSLGPFGENREYYVSRDKLSGIAPVQARVFLDRNYDGVFTEEDDEPIESARLNVGGRRSKEETNEDGIVTMLQSNVYQNVAATIDEASVDDPYYKISSKGYAIQPRPASMPIVDLPMIETGAIDGSVYYNETGNPVEGLTLELVNTEGEVIQTSETAFDGFYTFEFVPPGTYTVRADPQYGVDIPEQEIIVNPDELFASGVDMLLYSSDVSTVEDAGWDDLEYGPYLPGQDTGGEPYGPTLPFDQDLMGPVMPANKPDDDNGSVMGPIMPANKPDDDDGNAVGPVMPAMPNAGNAPAPKPSDAGMTATVQRVRIGEHPTMIRMVLDLSAPIEYKPMETEDGHMVVIDLPHTAWDAIEQWNGQHTPILGSFTVNAMPAGGTRLTLHAKSAMKIKASGVLPPSKSGGYRLFVDLYNPNNQ